MNLITEFNYTKWEIESSLNYELKHMVRFLYVQVFNNDLDKLL